MNNNDVSLEEANAEQIQMSRFPEDLTSSLLADAKTVFIEKLDQQQDNLKEEFGKLKASQNRARDINGLIRTINAATVDGELHCKDNAELKELLAKAANPVPGTTVPQGPNGDNLVPELPGVELDPNKFDYTKEELERLLSNLRSSVDDLNVINDMQLQNLNRMVTNYYEIYQMMKSIMKPLHEDKIAKARAISGR